MIPFICGLVLLYVSLGPRSAFVRYPLLAASIFLVVYGLFEVGGAVMNVPPPSAAPIAAAPIAGAPLVRIEQAFRLFGGETL